MSKSSCCPLAKFDRAAKYDDDGRLTRPGNFHYACNDPDRCTKCGQPNNSWVSGKARCKCDDPKMPRRLMNNDDDDRPTSRVRYGQ